MQGGSSSSALSTSLAPSRPLSRLSSAPTRPNSAIPAGGKSTDELSESESEGETESEWSVAEGPAAAAAAAAKIGRGLKPVLQAAKAAGKLSVRTAEAKAEAPSSFMDLRALTDTLPPPQQAPQ